LREEKKRKKDWKNKGGNYFFLSLSASLRFRLNTVLLDYLLD